MKVVLKNDYLRYIKLFMFTNSNICQLERSTSTPFHHNNFSPQKEGIVRGCQMLPDSPNELCLGCGLPRFLWLIFFWKLHFFHWCTKWGRSNIGNLSSRLLCYFSGVLRTSGSENYATFCCVNQFGSGSKQCFKILISP